MADIIEPVSIEAINARLKVLNDQNQAIYEEQRKLGDALVKLVMNNSDIINEAPWVKNNELSHALKSHERQHKRLADLLCKDYHCHLDSDLCTIYFDDSEITLAFRDDDSFNEFVLKHNVKFETKYIKDKIKHLERSIERETKDLEASRKLLAKFENK
jgi:hypothetical protein